MAQTPSAVESVSEPGAGGGGRPVGGATRRKMFALLAGAACAAVLAAALFSGLHSGLSSSGTTSSDVAPGIDAASASLLNLDVLSPGAVAAAPNFVLTDQRGQPVSLRQLRGKVVVWSLNDDQCTDLCPLLAQDIVAADRDLGPAANDVVFLAVNANPFYTSTEALRAWSVRNDLEPLANWIYVTGSPAQLERTWAAYHVTVIQDRAARTVVHDAAIEFIDPAGRIRAIGYFDEGVISTAYYAHALAQMADDLLPPDERVRVGGTSTTSASTKGATVGDPAPAFDLSRLGAPGAVTLAGLDTEPLVLNFWSSTCSICVQEMPSLQQTYTQFHGTVDVVGIDVADPRDAAASFARGLGARYPLLADAEGATAAAYRVDALPVTFIVAPGGTIVARHDGTLTEPELAAILEMDFPNLPQP
jgi:cytochrome oxidase Cu insertion factor (SCO1/SenC/PrrC family)/thiol-disulfide isomerase/thioredoxin